MNCQFDDMLLYDYLDQTLETEEQLTVERHLSACPSCRKKLSQIKLLYYELDNVDEIDLPDQVNQIRSMIVDSAFSEEKVSTVERLRRTKQLIEETPLVGALVPSKAKVKGAAKGLYKGSKKLYQSIPQKEKKKKPRKSLGGLL